MPFFSATFPKEDSLTIPWPPINSRGGAGLKMKNGKNTIKLFERNTADDNPREIQLWPLTMGSLVCVAWRALDSSGRLWRRRRWVAGAQSWWPRSRSRIRNRHKSPPQTSTAESLLLSPRPQTSSGTNNQMMMECPPLRP